MEGNLFMRSLSLAILTLISIKEVSSIGCFVCSSFNGNNTMCEDRFNSTFDKDPAHFKKECWAYKKGREGLFPADHCIKINGVGENNMRVIIRTCALDSGSLTADTEIVRISHCGHFKFQDTDYSGCVQSCDTDGCNSISSSFSLLSFIGSIITFIIFR